MATRIDLAGCVLDSKYEVVKRLQSGFFGTTWLAKDLGNQIDVCVKV